MAKGTISKRRGPSKHSREARRATSPGIDNDKSLKEVKAPHRESERPSVLAIHHGAGVTKKSKQGRNMSSKAKKRSAKAQERAEAILERTEKKVGKSKGQARTVESRRKAWEDINSQVPKAKETADAAHEDELEEEEVSDFDDEMDDAAAANAATLEAAKVTLPAATDPDDDEIL